MDIRCVKCGRELEVPDALVGRQGQCPICGALFHCGTRSGEGINSGNTSGQGAGARVPAEIMRWSWGAFIWTWIWSIFNRVWVGLLALLPGANLIMGIVLGIKGNEWAWRNKKWESVEHFRRVQRKWSIAGWAVIFIVLAGAVATVVSGSGLPVCGI